MALETIQMSQPRNRVAFPFDSSQVEVNATKVFAERNHLADFIESVIQKFQSETELPMAVIPWLLDTVRKDGKLDLRTLVLLGKSLMLIAEKYAEFEKLDAKARSINYILENADEVATIFCDFEAIAETFATSFNPSPPVLLEDKKD